MMSYVFATSFFVLCLYTGLKEEQALDAWQVMQQQLADIIDQIKIAKGDTPSLQVSNFCAISGLHGFTTCKSQLMVLRMWGDRGCANSSGGWRRMSVR